MKNAFLLSQLYAFITVFLWSTAYVFTKVSLEYFSATSLGVLRCLVASLCLLIIVIAKKLAPPRKNFIFLFILSGLTGFGLYLLAFNVGSLMLNATTSCVIISTSPIITALLATVIFREKLNARRWAAVGLAFSGILVMFLWEGTFAFSGGVAWMLCAAVLISVYNIVQRRLALQFDAMQITAYSFFAGTIFLLFFLPEAAGQLQTAPAGQILLVCFLGVFPSAIAYLFWAKALAVAPKTSNVTNYMFLTPFLSLVLDIAVTGALPGPGTFIGGGIILSGLLLFSLAGKR